MEEKYYLKTIDMTVGYDGHPLIRDIAFSIGRGEILTLIGPNGAGKTTILKNLIKELRPIKGSVFLDGRNLSDIRNDELAKHMSLVLTERITPEMMTCRDVVATGRYPYTGRFGILSDSDHQIVDETMSLTGTAMLSELDFMKISDGQRQRVMLARAICQQPDVIVLDEPTSFLDIRYKLEFLTILQKLARERELAVIMSLHELDLAERISDRILCVKGDRIDRLGSPEEIFEGDYIQELYGLTTGSYDEKSGSLEFEKSEEMPDIFVIAGNGSGTRLFRKLQREGSAFYTGILWENDLDYPAAKALASEVVCEKAFTSFSSENTDRAKQLIDGCSRVYVTVDLSEGGSLMEPLRALMEYAREKGKLH